MRQAMDIAVFFGMSGVTLLGLVFTPIFYVAVRKLFAGKMRVRTVKSAGSVLSI